MPLAVPPMAWRAGRRGLVAALALYPGLAGGYCGDEGSAPRSSWRSVAAPARRETDMDTQITGKTLIAWGYKPGPWFPGAIAAANAAQAQGKAEAEIRAAIDACMPARREQMALRKVGDLAHRLNIRAEDPDEVANVEAVERHMVELMRVPTGVAGTVMPDACPAGSAPGTIPVGGVIAAKDAIHPGMHSADICCSMAATLFHRDIDPRAILDAGMRLSHFGGGGRARGEQIRPSEEVMAPFA